MVVETLAGFYYSESALWIVANVARDAMCGHSAFQGTLVAVRHLGLQ
jgi:hypothetical protein